MSYLTERRADKRADVAEAREQARLDADAASQRRIRERDALAAQARTDADAVAKRERAEQARRDAVRDQRKAARRAALRRIREWATGHVVDLLIYPLAVASGVLAIPSMAAFGMSVYGNATGIVLPILSELGMWAFAAATTVSRRAHPERPVWALQLGTWVFAAVCLTLNVLHGVTTATDNPATAGTVMGVASVAGVLAHQLVTAAPRRTAADRRAATLAKVEAAKVLRIRRAAVRQAVAAVDEAGRAELVYEAGRYVLGKRGRLLAAIDRQPTPVVLTVDTPARSEPSSPLADEVAAWLEGQDPGPHALDSPGTVATLDPEPEQPKSRRNRPRKSTRTRKPVTRSIEDLRAELAALLADDPAAVDTTSAESIRKALRCAPKRARELRDERHPTTD